MTEANGDGIIIGVTDADFESSGKAWGFAPATGRLSTTRNVVPSAGHNAACGGLRGGSAAGATATLVVDMSRRALAVALNGGPPCEAAVRLPRAVRVDSVFSTSATPSPSSAATNCRPTPRRARAAVVQGQARRVVAAPSCRRGDAPRPDPG